MTTTLLARPARPLGTVRLTLPAGARPVRSPSVAVGGARGVPSSSPAVEVRADLPFPVLVARAQQAERDGTPLLWLTGAGAAAVASRLLRLTRVLAVGAELDLGQGARGAALDAVALTQIGGARAHVRVADARLLGALARELGLRPRARATRFGGDAFTATLPPAGHQEVQVTAVVTHQGDLVAAFPVASTVVVTAPSGVDAHVLVRRARAAGRGGPTSPSTSRCPRVSVRPPGRTRTAWCWRTRR
ncbi:hypothetical protein [Litorihabitans aurantiacus]|uniref:hypothetical protein n=1 Tax=Litorihabitans aurantiacus TaxID=1930061 RepID=UPI0024E0A99C|nr:hypothetical protein [Litorihabitans aurantiacus]